MHGNVVTSDQQSATSIAQAAPSPQGAQAIGSPALRAPVQLAPQRPETHMRPQECSLSREWAFPTSRRPCFPELLEGARSVLC